MAGSHYRVEVHGDHIEKLTHARPIQAVAELVWNALDADATDVRIEVESTDMSMKSVSVSDNGHGIPHEEIRTLFGQLGGSWKAHGSRSKTQSRMLHGKEGKGRFKALALGRVADWSVVYAATGSRQRYTITLIKDKLTDVRVTDPVNANGAPTGVNVRVTELHRDFRSLKGGDVLQSLSEIFALYLSDYGDVRISLDGEALDPAKAIATRKRFDLEPIREDGQQYPVVLELIEWKTKTNRAFYLCTGDGFPLYQHQLHFHLGGFQFSAYLKSSYISRIHAAGALELAEMNPSLQATCEAAQQQIKTYFRTRDAETARSAIEKWKTERVYPYATEPQTSVEEAERKVFDIVALNVNRHLPDFAGSSRKTKAFQLRMLRQAIESGSEELQKILHEVLDLPGDKQRELARLLEEASLANIISASKLVADRLKFLAGLDTLLFNPAYKSRLKERSQLHRILADNNTWLFGEAFSLTVDDQSLTEVLRKHRKHIGEDTAIDRPVTMADGKKGIVDLMFSRSVPQNRFDEREHLVVELKRPTVKIGTAEIMQVKNYAFAIANDERFEALRTRWNFWVISNAFEPAGKYEARQSDRLPGQVHKHDNIEIWCKTWSEILAGAKSRMKFVEEHLKANIDKETGLQHLRQTYEKYLSGVIDDAGNGRGGEAP